VKEKFPYSTMRALLAPKILEVNSLLKQESPSKYYYCRSDTVLDGVIALFIYFVCFHVKSSASNEDNSIWLLTTVWASKVGNLIGVSFSIHLLLHYLKIITLLNILSYVIITFLKFN
jgi:hypothetical protein